MRILILLWSLSLPAFAQVAPPCFPLVNGYPVGVPAYARGEVGQHIYWRCSDSKGSPAKWYGFSCAHGSCSNAVFAASIATITRASGKVTAAKAEYAAHIDFDCDVEQPAGSVARALCQERASLLNQHSSFWTK